uniref:hypothetical protein n=1 Tax=Petrachloros mirabilis TaxID=2918835 RepID=UPI001EE8E8AF|nr:hypothetical protein [Petrachloros mirabilis]
MASNRLKHQLLWVALGCVALTLAFGTVLSVAVNISLQQLENQPELGLPGADRADPLP